ncbi:MAG: hypothetical protein CSYNP_00269 [Syntrophus sp. SKADARSKE-3]|nr:hypothetical protein [Syntrophus sp. SKADARSKE-3]
MANYSVWYFAYKKAIDGTGLYSKYLQGDAWYWEDDATARELISRAHIASSQIWANLWLLADYWLGDDNTGLQLITTMIITKSPQTFIFRGFNYGHAVTVYRYKAGRFYIYDNNFPGEEVTVDWSPSPIGGFRNYSKEAAYHTIIKFGFEAFSSAFSAKTFETLYTGAEGGWTNSKFRTINITSPVLNSDNSATFEDRHDITIAGSVTGGIGTAKYLVYSVNKEYGLGGQLINLGSDGSFSFTIPNRRLFLDRNYIKIMSADDPEDANRRIPHAYAGFKEITIKVWPKI